MLPLKDFVKLIDEFWYVSDSANDAPKRENDIPVLAGSAKIGQLYDAKKDQLLFDRFLWSDMSVNEANITSVITDTYIEESVVERTKHMDVSASVKLSMFGGLVKVSFIKSYRCFNWIVVWIPISFLASLPNG